MDILTPIAMAKVYDLANFSPLQNMKVAIYNNVINLRIQEQKDIGNTY